MGKRIKLIYILSLFSALMAISVQAYWLYNQYRYEVERYADEIAADVLRVGDEEFAERRKMAIGDDTSYIIDRSSRTQSGTSTIRNVQTQLCFDFKTDVLVDSIRPYRKTALFMVWNEMSLITIFLSRLNV